MKRQAPFVAAAALAIAVGGIGGYFLLSSKAPAPSGPGLTVSLFGGGVAAPAADGAFGAGIPSEVGANAPAAPDAPAAPTMLPSSPAAPEAPPEGYAVYRSERYGLSFFYEKGGRIREFDEGAGATSITLEDEARGHALQIYILPYEEKTISEERFRKDLPSGVRTGEEMITLYGVPAVAFKSEAPLVGPTREVWFLRGGYLYELSVPLPMEAWLQKLLPGFRLF